MKTTSFMVAAMFLAMLVAAGCSRGGSSSQQIGQLANQTQELADQLQVAASVDAVKAQQVTLTILGDTLSRLQSQVATLPAAEDLDTQITAVATLVSSVQTQLGAELEALKAGTTSTYHNYSSSIRSITLQVKDIAADIAAGGATSSLPVAQQLEASQLATAQVELVAMQSVINGLPTTITDAFNPQITTLTTTLTDLQQQVAGSTGMPSPDLDSLSGQVDTAIDQVAALIGSAAIAAGDLANLSISQQTQVATLTTLAASASALASANVTVGADGDAAVAQAQLDAANATIVTLNETVTDIQTQLGTANATTTAQSGTITDLQTQIATANATISQLEAAVDSLAATVDALQNPAPVPLPVDFTVSDDGSAAKTVVAKIAPGAASTMYFSLATFDGSAVTATLSSASQPIDGAGAAAVTVTENQVGKSYILTATTVNPNAGNVAKAVTDFVVDEAVAAGAGTVTYQGSVTVSMMAVGWQIAPPQPNGGTMNVKSAVATAGGVYSIVSETVGFVTTYSHLEKRDSATGGLVWATPTTSNDSINNLYLSPAGEVYVYGIINGNLTLAPQTSYVAKLNAATGAYTWSWTAPGAVDDVVFDPAGNLYVSSGKIVAVSSAGAMLWQTGVINGSIQLAVKDATLYNTNSSFGVITLAARSIASGAQLWSRAVFSGDISSTGYDSRSIAATDAVYIAKSATSYNGGTSYIAIEKVALDGTPVSTIYTLPAGVFDARLITSGGNIYTSYQLSPVAFGVTKLTSTGYSWAATYPTSIGQTLQLGIAGSQLYSSGGSYITKFNDLPL